MAGVLFVFHAIRDKQWKKLRPLAIGLGLLILFIAMSGCSTSSRGPEVVQKPKLSEIDPTDSTTGLGERITTQGAQLVDSAIPKTKRPTFKINSDVADVIKLNQGDSTTVILKISPKNQNVSNVLLGWPDEQKYVQLPVTHQDSGKVTFTFRSILQFSLGCLRCCWRVRMLRTV